MAEPTNVTSGEQASFTFRSTILLLSAVEDTGSIRRQIRELKSELEALLAVLMSLMDEATQNGTDFSSLDLAFHHCGLACSSSEAMITARPGEQGLDTTGFKNMLAAFSSTFKAVVVDAKL